MLQWTSTYTYIHNSTRTVAYDRTLNIGTLELAIRLFLKKKLLNYVTSLAEPDSRFSFESLAPRDYYLSKRFTNLTCTKQIM